MDELAPTAREYVPARHAEQAATDAAPAVGPYVPEIHCTHDVEPTPLTWLYEPARHIVQLVAPASEKEPALHWTGDALVVAQNEPAGHVVHAEAPPREYLPGGHAAQVAIDVCPEAAEAVPAGQGEHKPAPEPE